jgi:glycosyltransferase involved in cell wall biosynthesis
MNENKMCFIYCINDEDHLKKSLYHIKQLHVPPAMEIEYITMENAPGLAAGYNYAMRRTDAKYKVYLHQDVFILNQNFLIDILSLFRKYPVLGMLGVVGTKNLPENGVWWEGKERYGKVYESSSGQMMLLSFDEVISVTAIDGLMIVTQYDVPWREDLFKGWHFYDLSQSAEFIKAGYQVGIPKQIEPWCIHNCGLVNVENGFEEDRSMFINAYMNVDQVVSNDEEVNDPVKQDTSNIVFTKKKISPAKGVEINEYPLVSVLIPAYNRPHFLELALNSVLNQTYKHIEIIICDDSTNDEVQSMLVPYLEKYENIKYVKNEKRLVNRNVDRCFELATGEYINYLLDDDLFHHEKIEKMLHYFLNEKDISLVTSYRQTIDENGNHLSIGGGTVKLYEQTTIVDGKILMNFVLKNLLNVIGEWTTVLFRKKDCNEQMSSYQGIPYFVVQDVAMWAKLLTKGKAVYISEPLSYFRYHTGQRSSETKIQVLAIEEWAQFIRDVHKKGFLHNESDYKMALTNHLKQSVNILQSIVMLDKFSVVKELNAEEKIKNAISYMVQSILDTQIEQ